MTFGRDRCEIYSSTSVEVNRLKNVPNSQNHPVGLHPWKPGPWEPFPPGRPPVGHLSRHPFSFSSQGDMGVLGPIGYPGPKGMKVKTTILYSRLCHSQAPPDPFQPRRKGALTRCWEMRGWGYSQRGAGVEAGKSGAWPFSGLIASCIYVSNARHPYWAAVLQLSLSLTWF